MADAVRDGRLAELTDDELTDDELIGVLRAWRRLESWSSAGTLAAAALAGYSLPPAEVLEADQRLTDRALALCDAGLLGSLEELRAHAYLDTLLGRDSTPPCPADPPSPANPPVPSALAARINLTLRWPRPSARPRCPARSRASARWTPRSSVT